ALEPRNAPVKPPVDPSGVMDDHTVLAGGSAGKLHGSDFHSRRFISRNTRIRDGDAPEHDRMKIRWPAGWVYITRLVANFIRNFGIVQPGEHKCTRRSGGRCQAYPQKN